MKKLLLRIGAFEYEPSPLVQQHTLDVRLKEVLNDAKEFEYREQIACAENLLMDIAAEQKLQTNKHVSYL